MPLFGPPNIERLKAKRDIKGLIDALAYKKDAVIRAQAATAFREVWDAAAIQPLMDATKDVDDQVVLAAFASLKEANDPLAFDGLLKLATDLASRARGMAIGILGQKQDSRAVEPLIQVLRTDPDPNGRQWAVEALQMIGNAKSIDALDLATRDPVENVMQAAINALELSANPQAYEKLLEMMADANHPRKGYIAVALGRKRDVRAVETLIAALKYDPVPIVRYWALWALQQIESTKTLEAITSATTDPDDKVMEASIHALEQSTNPLAANRLLEILLDKTHRGRHLAVQALGKSGEKRAIEPLIEILMDDNNWQSQAVAAHALRNMDWQPTTAQHQALMAVALQEWSKVPEIGVETIEPLLAAIENSKDVNLRDEASKALAQLKDNRAIETLCKALESTNTDVRRAALVALEQFTDPRAIQPLLQTFNREIAYDMQLSVVRTLTRLGDKTIHNILATRADSTDPKVCLAAAKMLVTIGDAQGIDILISLLVNDIDMDQDEIVITLLNISDQRVVAAFSQVKEEAVNRLLKASRHVRSWLRDSPEPPMRKIRAVGRVLNAVGGKTLMRDVHAQFVANGGQGRHLEMMWSGIGTWMG